MNGKDENLGLVRLSERCYGYMQKDEGLGWSNSGMIAATTPRSSSTPCSTCPSPGRCWPRSKTR